MDVATRELHRGRVWRVLAHRLVERRGETLVLWYPERSPMLRPFAGGRELRIPGDVEWALEEAPTGTEAVTVVRLGDRHSTAVVRRGGAFAYWYVNFERHTRWEPPLFDLVDEKLDLVVEADGTTRLKDEDELAEAARVGYLDEAEVRAELARVLAAPPWPTGWEDWRPDPSWPAPRLPAGWDAV